MPTFNEKPGIGKRNCQIPFDAHRIDPRDVLQMQHGTHQKLLTTLQDTNLDCSSVNGHSAGKVIVPDLGEFDAEMLDSRCPGHCLKIGKRRPLMPDGGCHGLHASVGRCNDRILQYACGNRCARRRWLAAVRHCRDHTTVASLGSTVARRGVVGLAAPGALVHSCARETQFATSPRRAALRPYALTVLGLTATTDDQASRVRTWGTLTGREQSLLVALQFPPKQTIKRKLLVGRGRANPLPPSGGRSPTIATAAPSRIE